MSNDSGRETSDEATSSQQQANDATPIEESNDAEEYEEEPPATPFDHPYFLPILLAGGAIWFGYDGWFNSEIKAVTFNRVGSGLLLLGAAYFGFQGKRELDAEKPDKRD